MESILEKVKADRVFFDSLGNSYPPDSRVDIRRDLIAGVDCYWFVPRSYDGDEISIYLHGGMFGLGSLQSHKSMVSHIASALSARVLFIEYSLAPEKPFPNALNEVLKVYRELIRTYSSSKITIIGDSAGGGLAATLIKMASQEKLEMPLAVILISPWIYLQCNTASHDTRKDIDPILTKEKLLEYANYYVAGNWNEADPGEFTFDSFPPLLILVGGNEILFDDSKNFYEKIRPLQPDTEMKEYKNQIHVWLFTDIESQDSQNALADIKRFITKNNVSPAKELSFHARQQG